MYPTRTLVSALAVMALGLLASAPATAAPSGGRLELLRASPSVTLDKYPGSPVYLDVGAYVAAVGGPFQLNATRAGYRSPIRVRQIAAGRVADAARMGGRRLVRPAPVPALHRSQRGGQRDLERERHLLSGRLQHAADRSERTGESHLPAIVRLQPVHAGRRVGARPRLGGGPGGHGAVDSAPARHVLDDRHDPAAVHAALRHRGGARADDGGRQGGEGPAVLRPGQALGTRGGHRFAHDRADSHPPRSLDPARPGAAAVLGHLDREAGRPRLPRLRRDRVGSRPGADGHRGLPPPGHERDGRLRVLLQERRRRRPGQGRDAPRTTPSRATSTGISSSSCATRCSTRPASLVVRSQKDGFCLAPDRRRSTSSSTARCGTPTRSASPARAATRRRSGRARRCRRGGATPTCRRSPASRSTSPNLPNGTYYVSIEANPLGAIYEVRTGNDTSLRKVILGGTPAKRTVRVPAWNGIDPEG